VANQNLSNQLIEMIERVSKAESESAARNDLLKSLLSMFKMDQSALYEKVDSTYGCRLAVDRSGAIMKATTSAFGSVTLLDQAFMSMEPLYRNFSNTTSSIPKSIKEDSLRQIVILPLSRNPSTAIFLGSRMESDSSITTEALEQFKIAARAAWLAINHFRTAENLQKAERELQTIRTTRKSLTTGDTGMIKILDEVARVSGFNVSLLLLGESGVGKEEIARWAHEKSGRKGAFVPVNCATLSESLLESELFGFRKGAFTGANQNREGLFRAAEGGTLFLDEIGEIPIGLQAKLLRALQERKVRPVGSDEEINVDVRIISATHQDLGEKVQQGQFRADLFYRLQEFIIRIPALRERLVDIELLAEQFLIQATSEMSLPEKKFTPDCLKKMVDYSWPGNIRELKSACRMAAILSRNPEIFAEDLRLQVLNSAAPASFNGKLAKKDFVESPRGQSLKEMARDYERKIVRDLLAQGKSQVEAAAVLEISVRTLHRILSEEESENLSVQL